MSPIVLSIETATRVCSVAVHKGTELLASQVYHQEKSHASLLPTIIQQVVDNLGLSLNEVDAFAVSSGPGSYTGLRIGFSSVKGMAYALGKPIIAIPTLDAMLLQAKKTFLHEALFCPMIDARRMEVYCLLASHTETIWTTSALIIDESTFSEFGDTPVYLFGDGAAKTRDVLSQDNLNWLEDWHPSAQFIGELAFARWEQSEFDDLAYSEPIYLKEFAAKPAKKLV